MRQNMTDVLNLVRSGRLRDATDAIQSRIRGAGAGAGAGDAAPAGSAMRDVTPTARALPGDAPAAPHRRSRPNAKAVPPDAWERRAGALPHRLFRPSAAMPDAPLIVMLHGCTQTPEDFSAGTRMNDAADRIGAHVIWPGQERAANANGCWNWFEPAHQGRGGEPAAIAALVTRIAAEVAPGASGIHVAGLSAGGAMAAILGVRYPELFSSVGVHSGLPVGAARDVASAFAVMRSGASGGEGLRVPAIVFHGSADRTVAPANGAAVAVDGPDAGRPRRRTARIGGRDVIVTRTAGADGRPRRELWEVVGLGHAWSGGSAAGSYADPAGPDATAEMLRFFREVDGRP